MERYHVFKQYLAKRTETFVKAFNQLKAAEEYIASELLPNSHLFPGVIYIIKDMLFDEVVKEVDPKGMSEKPKEQSDSPPARSPFSTRPTLPGMSGMTPAQEGAKEEDKKK